MDGSRDDQRLPATDPSMLESQLFKHRKAHLLVAQLSWGSPAGSINAKCIICKRPVHLVRESNLRVYVGVDQYSWLPNGNFSDVGHIIVLEVFPRGHPMFQPPCEFHATDTRSLGEVRRLVRGSSAGTEAQTSLWSSWG